MSIRSTHKASIKGILETISYKSSLLDVFDEVKLSHSTVPYVFITSGSVRPTREGTTFTNSGYMRMYTYFINLVCQASEDQSLLNEVETELDALEGLILDKLQADATRYNGVWQDLYCTDVSSPYAGADLNMNDSYIIKTFSVTVEVPVPRS